MARLRFSQFSAVRVVVHLIEHPVGDATFLLLWARAPINKSSAEAGLCVYDSTALFVLFEASWSGTSVLGPSARQPT
jgi:hypothetical protein